MAWVLIVSSLVVLWVASLCKILHWSSSPAKGSFLSTGGVLRKRNVLLVVAHPDDESMFFTPAINYLTARGHNLHILCLSIGNADGKGNIRKEELRQACVVLKVPLQQVKIMDDPDLQDGFGRDWNHSLLAKIIEEEVISYGIDLANMEGAYGSECPMEEKVKHRATVALEACYISVHEAPGASTCEILTSSGRKRTCLNCFEDEEPMVGFVHYRFILEEDIPVLYVYELQLKPHVRAMGLGKFLMQLTELIASKSSVENFHLLQNHTSAVMLTVQKANSLAMNFYLNKLSFADTVSPSRVDPLMQETS